MQFKRSLSLWVPVWTGIAAVLLIFVFWRALVIHGESEIRKQTVAEAGRVHDKIKSEILAQIYALEQMAKEWTIQGGLPKKIGKSEDFSAYFRGYAAFQWVEFPFKVRWQTPFSEGKTPAGYDLASKELQEILKQAVQSKREVQVTQSFTLPDGHKAFMICKPVFTKGRSNGFLLFVGIFRVEELLDEVLKDNRSRGYSLIVSEGAGTVYSRFEGSETAGEKWKQNIEISLPGALWRVQIWPGTKLLSQMESFLYAVLLVGGALLALLLMATVHFSQTSRLRGKEIVRIQQDRRQLAAIVEHSDDAIMSKNLEGVITTWNRGAGRLFGYTAEEAIGKPFSILVPDELRGQIPEILERVKHGEGLDNKEARWKRKDGSLLDVSLTVSLMRNDAGAVIGFSTIVRDITERKRAEELLKRQAEDLARSNKDLEVFAAVASHDLQAPVQKIIGFSQLLLQKQEASLDDKSRDYLHRVVGSAERMSQLISDLLSYSKVTKRQEPFKPVDLNKALFEALSDLELRIKEKNGKVEKDKLPVIWGDEVQMRQLFQNLVGNALKFHKKDETPRVMIKYNGISAGFHEISVQDDGIGFDEKYLERIFEPFERLHTVKEYEGTGIGLSTCQKIIDRHGGKLTAKSELGKGSVFFVLLPDGKGA